MLEAAAAVLAEVRGARYFARHTITLTEAESSMTLASEGLVLVRHPQPGPEPGAAGVRIEGKLLSAGDTGADVSFAVASDGLRVRARIEDPGESSRILWEAHLGEGGDELLQLGRPLLLPEFRPQDPFGDASPTRVTLLPDETLDDVRCRVIAFTREAGAEDPEQVEWAFGAEDHLPRRIRSLSRFEEGETEEVLTLHQLAANPEIDPGRFVLEVPEGWTVEPYGEEEHHEHGLLAPGAPAPNWVLQDPAGVEHTLLALRGKVVVLDFWATWCAPCRATMPALENLHRRFLNQDVVVLGMSAFEHGDPAGTMREQGFTYGLLLDADEVAADYHVTGLPTLYLIGVEGRVLFAHTGHDEHVEETLTRVVTQHLEERKR